MNKILEKFLISFFITLFFYVLIYFIVFYYDYAGETILRFKKNIYYLIFLFISIVGGLSLYGNENNKSKFIISIIFLVNFVYLIFIFSVGNIGLSRIQGLFLIGFLLLGLVFSNLRNRVGNVVIIASVLGIFLTIFFTLIPLYGEGPDLEGFENNFETQLITYSKIGLHTNVAILEKDNKKYNLIKGIKNYDLAIGPSGSNITFKANNLYLNAFGYILFKNKEILQIYPQTAIKINPNFEIEIITGMVKYYPQEIKSFSFTGKNIALLIVDQENIDIILGRYDDQLKNYIWEQNGKEIHQNKTILLISKNTLEFLNKIFPRQFKQNLENFDLFDKYLEYNLEEKEDLKTFDQENIKKGIWQSVKDGLKFTEIIK